MPRVTPARCHRRCLLLHVRDAGRVNDRSLVVSFRLDHKLSLVLNDVVHWVPRTPTENQLYDSIYEVEIEF